MSFVRYTAERSLIPASPTRQGQSLDFQLRLRGLTAGRDVIRKESVALSGDQETIRFRGNKRWEAVTAHVLRGTTEFIQMREFLDSVEGGETFELDPYGTVGDSPADLRDVKLTSKGYTETRTVQRGAGGGTDYFSWSFAMREL
jgi:hypothetical protein